MLAHLLHIYAFIGVLMVITVDVIGGKFVYKRILDLLMAMCGGIILLVVNFTLFFLFIY